MDIQEAIRVLLQLSPNPSTGLPEELFQFISRVTPLVNVDLLIKNKNNQTLLSWRKDLYAGIGWHIPGGIIRYKEKIEDRILRVAKGEIGTTVKYNPNPLSINEMFCYHDVRGHFISLLYECSIPSDYTINNRNLSPNDIGYLQWHNCCPDNLVKAHSIYRKYI